MMYVLTKSGVNLKIEADNGDLKYLALAGLMVSAHTTLPLPETRTNVLVITSNAVSVRIGMSEITSIVGVAPAATLGEVADQIQSLATVSGGSTGGTGTGTGTSVTLTNNLSTSATGTALDAAQGKMLNDLIVSLKGGSSTSIATLVSQLATLNALVTGTTADGDVLVSTIQELLAVFSNYPEGASVADALAGKVNTSDVVNILTQTAAGKVLDARQGKALKDLADTNAANIAANTASIATNTAAIAALSGPLQFKSLGLSITSGVTQVVTYGFGPNTGIDRIIFYETGTRVSVDMPFDVTSVTDTDVTIQPTFTGTGDLFVIGHKRT